MNFLLFLLAKDANWSEDKDYLVGKWAVAGLLTYIVWGNLRFVCLMSIRMVIHKKTANGASSPSVPKPVLEDVFF